VLDRVLPPAPTAALLLVIGTAATGALHLDGLMDTADGVLGAGTPERRLAIMRDSRVGAFGVSAGILVILSQFACLVELTGAARLITLVVVFATSRWVMTLALGVFPPARRDGLGTTLHAASGRGPLVVGTLLAAVIALASGPLGMMILAGGAVVALAGGHLLTRLLSGLTGDTYGALAVLTETLGLNLAVAVLPAGSGW
jgi:adenosylcobinamide-GDP ribazoletransferase